MFTSDPKIIRNEKDKVTKVKINSWLKMYFMFNLFVNFGVILEQITINFMEIYCHRICNLDLNSYLTLWANFRNCVLKYVRWTTPVGIQMYCASTKDRYVFTKIWSLPNFVMKKCCVHVVIMFVTISFIFTHDYCFLFRHK